MHLRQRRSLSRMQTSLLCEIISEELCPERIIWSKEQNQKLCFETILLHWTADNCIVNIRMLQKVFMYICQ